MVYEDEDDEYIEEDEDFDEPDEDEDVEVYDYVEEVRRRGDVIEIKISAIDICCPVILQLTKHQAFKLIKELAKTLNKDEIKELTAELIDVVMK